MAGIFDYINSPSNSGTIPVHVMDWVYIFRSTGDFNDTQLLNGINQFANPDIANPSEAFTDLAAIASEMNGQPNTLSKLVYLEKIRAVFGCVEAGVVDEATARSILGIAVP